MHIRIFVDFVRYRNHYTLCRLRLVFPLSQKLWQTFLNLAAPKNKVCSAAPDSFDFILKNYAQQRAPSDN